MKQQTCMLSSRRSASVSLSSSVAMLHQRELQVIYDDKLETKTMSEEVELEIYRRKAFNSSESASDAADSFSSRTAMIT